MKIEIYQNTADLPWTYAMLDQRQREIAREIRQNQASPVLLVSELAPVITLGRHTDDQDFQIAPQELEARGISIYRTDRGGRATSHGPGQWVVFPVTPLKAWTGDARGIKTAISRLLNASLEVGLQYDPDCEIREGAELGVWNRSGKFASVGIYVQDGILLHGLSVNGYASSTSFYGIRPCGLRQPVSYLLSALPPDRVHEGFETLRKQIVLAVLKTFKLPP